MTVTATIETELYIEVINDDEIEDSPERLSYSRMKRHKNCPRSFYLRYVKRMIVKWKESVVLNSGVTSHDSIEDFHKRGFQDKWLSMDRKELAQDIFTFLWKRARAHKKFPKNSTLVKNGLVNFALFSVKRFFKIKASVSKEEVAKYFMPVIAEKRYFDKRDDRMFLFVPDAVYQLVPVVGELRPRFMVLDFKAGGSKPKSIRKDDRIQCVGYGQRLVELDIIDGIVTHVAVFYLALEKPFVRPFKPSDVKIFEEMEEDVRDAILLEDWHHKWGTRACQFSFREKTIGEWLDAECEYKEHCSKTIAIGIDDDFDEEHSSDID